MSLITYNKQFVPSDQPHIRFNDRGFTLGHGLFETILINHGAIPALDYHWRRLETSAPLIGISLPFNKIELEYFINILISENNLKNKIAGARITITHGESERGLLPLQTPTPQFLISVFECPAPSEKPFTALIVNTQKNEHSISSRIKSISYLDNILAKKEAQEQKYDEAILLNTVSNIADGSMSNIYMVVNDQIFTPPIKDGALPGVLRTMLLEEFSEDFPIQECSISPLDLQNAHEVFLTNALIGIKSVRKVNSKNYTSFYVAENIKKNFVARKNYI